MNPGRFYVNILTIKAQNGFSKLRQRYESAIKLHYSRRVPTPTIQGIRVDQSTVNTKIKLLNNAKSRSPIAYLSPRESFIRKKYNLSP